MQAAIEDLFEEQAEIRIQVLELAYSDPRAPAVTGESRRVLAPPP